jgi:predicted RNA binding protein with dsRBD fold (UPF0201 family)
MKLKTDKVDEAVLALLHLTSFRETDFGIEVTRSWKGHDRDALNRLHEKGLIENLHGKAKSVVFTAEGKDLPKKLFDQMFCESS